MLRPGNSLGVIIYELLSGVRPYSASSIYEWVMLHTHATPPELTPHGVPPQLARAIRRMLATRPEQRQQTMREVIQDLRTASHGLRGHSGPGLLAPAGTDGALLDRVWGDHVFIEERTVDVHVKRLREALAPGQAAAMVETVRGAGYRLTQQAGMQPA